MWQQQRRTHDGYIWHATGGRAGAGLTTGRTAKLALRSSDRPATASLQCPTLRPRPDGPVRPKRSLDRFCSSIEERKKRRARYESKSEHSVAGNINYRAAVNAATTCSAAAAKATKLSTYSGGGDFCIISQVTPPGTIRRPRQAARSVHAESVHA